MISKVRKRLPHHAHTSVDRLLHSAQVDLVVFVDTHVADTHSAEDGRLEKKNRTAYRIITQVISY